MPTSIRITDANFTSVIASIYPQPTGLLGFFLPKVDAPTSIANKVFGGAAGSVVGAPTYNANSVSGLLSTACFDSGLTITGNATYLILCKLPASGARLMGNYLSTDANLGDFIDWTGSGGGGFRIFASKGATQASGALYFPAGYDASKFYMLAGTIDTVLISAYAFINGQLNTIQGPLSGRVAKTDKTVRMGATYTASAGPAEAALFGIWNRALSSGQLQDVYNWVISNLGSVLSIS